MADELLVGKALSPVAETTGSFNSDNDDLIPVDDVSKFEDPPQGKQGVAMLCAVDGMQSNDPADFETVVYSGISDGNLVGVTSVEGDPRTWEAGTSIASAMGAVVLKRINDNITEAQGDITSLQGDLSDAEGDISDLSGDLTDHENETADANDVHGAKTYADNNKVDKSGDSMSGDLDVDGNKIGDPVLVAQREKDVSMGESDSVDCSLGTLFTKDLSGDVTLSFDNVPTDVFSFTLVLFNSGHSVTFPAGVNFPDGEAPDMEGTSVLTFFTTDEGSTWYGFLAGSDMS